MALLHCESTRLTMETRTTAVCTCPKVHAQILPSSVMGPTTTTSTSNPRQVFNDAVRDQDFLLLETMVARCGVNVNVFDADGQTALTRGCFNGDVKLVKFLVGLGADVRLANRAGWSCLHIATFIGHWKLMTFLIRTLKEQTEYDQRSANDYVMLAASDDVTNGSDGDSSERSACLTPPPEL